VYKRLAKAALQILCGVVLVVLVVEINRLMDSEACDSISVPSSLNITKKVKVAHT